MNDHDNERHLVKLTFRLRTPGKNRPQCQQRSVLSLSGFIHQGGRAAHGNLLECGFWLRGAADHSDQPSIQSGRNSGQCRLRMVQRAIVPRFRFAQPECARSERDATPSVLVSKKIPPTKPQTNECGRETLSFGLAPLGDQLEEVPPHSHITHMIGREI
jgi:hypothetical protein